MSISKNFVRRFTESHNHTGFCYVSLVRKVRKKSIHKAKHGGDDVVHSFEDGSKLIERSLVRELQMLKM